MRARMTSDPLEWSAIHDEFHIAHETCKYTAGETSGPAATGQRAEAGTPLRVYVCKTGRCINTASKSKPVIILICIPHPDVHTVKKCNVCQNREDAEWGKCLTSRQELPNRLKTESSVNCHRAACCEQLQRWRSILVKWGWANWMNAAAAGDRRRGLFWFYSAVLGSCLFEGLVNNYFVTGDYK